jgi:hypothetical protein
MPIDFWGVLGENEIHFKSGRRQFTNHDGLETDTVIGDVLVSMLFSRIYNC